MTKAKVHTKTNIKKIKYGNKLPQQLDALVIFISYIISLLVYSRINIIVNQFQRMIAKKGGRP